MYGIVPASAVVANGRVARESPFKRVWIQPAAGDAGGSVGAALCGYHLYKDQPRQVSSGRERVGTLSRSGSTARCYSSRT